MFVKEVFIKKISRFYSGKYIDEHGFEHYVPGSFQCFTQRGCRKAIEKWIKKEKVTSPCFNF